MPFHPPDNGWLFAGLIFADCRDTKAGRGLIMLYSGLNGFLTWPNFSTKSPNISCESLQNLFRRNNV
jgi:hypothetical protein